MEEKFAPNLRLVLVGRLLQGLNLGIRPVGDTKNGLERSITIATIGYLNHAPQGRAGVWRQN